MEEKHDIKWHLPQRYENFFQGLETGNVDMISESFDNIKELEDEDFNKQIGVLEKDLKKDIESIQNNVFKTIQDSSVTKNLDDVIKCIDQAQERVETRNNRFSKEIKIFMIQWKKQQNHPNNIT